MCPVHPHSLQPDPVSSMVVGEERECHGCGYDLRGLPILGRCPECGLPIAPVGQIDDPLCFMPPVVIRTFLQGGVLTALVMLAIVGLWVAVVTFPISNDRIIWGLAGAISVLWVGSVWLLTPAFTLPQAIHHGFAPRSRLRRCARWLQLGWTAAALVLFLRLAVPQTMSEIRLVMIILAWTFTGVGLVGLMLLAVMLERLAVWTRDATAEIIFAFAQWGCPISFISLLAAVLMTNLTRISAVLTIVSAISMFVSLAAMAIGVMLTCRSVGLSAWHSFEHSSRRKRQQARAEERSRELQEQIGRMDRRRKQSG